MKVNYYQNIEQLDKEAKRDYIDRHSAFVQCANSGNRAQKFAVKVKVGDQYPHPDDYDHFISWVQLWNGDNMLAQASFTAGAQGGIPGNLEVDFQIVPQKNLKLTAMAFCTKHGLWQSEEVKVEVS